MAIIINEMDNTFSDLNGFLKAYRTDNLIRVIINPNFSIRKSIPKNIDDIEALLIDFFNQFNIDAIGEFNYEESSYNGLVVVEVTILNDNFLDKVIRKNKILKIIKTSNKYL